MTRPTAQHAIDRIDGHEQVCAERYRRIDEKLDELAGGQRSMLKGGWALVIAICGWLALQVYDGIKDRPSPIAEAHAATITPPAP